MSHEQNKCQEIQCNTTVSQNESKDIPHDTRVHLRLKSDSKPSRDVTAPPNADSPPAAQPTSLNQPPPLQHQHMILPQLLFTPLISPLFPTSLSQTRRAERRDGAFTDETLITHYWSCTRQTVTVSQRLSDILRFRSFQLQQRGRDGTPTLEVWTQEGVQRARRSEEEEGRVG
ncbi:hypothetical protein L207DRAFT_587691 [Hyaloscypha variabilis F]|uniref:Uncharacterized protein n=1 Tax=Hyaloscypha variabilis (strain UAMH 11265 / GT02V1 / F) TaxID=1149755 RepID=A0A2J6RA34_HYAVF|nr:hypothetical protein L207DRAFT_587691 [Hyaloscypha variabilis F]